MEHRQLQDLPKNVRGLVFKAVRVLIERGPRGLVTDGLCVPSLCAPEAVATMEEYVNDYPGHFVDPPETAELWTHVQPDGIWNIDLPLHNDREGRMDLFLFMDIDPVGHLVRVTDLHAP